MKKQLFRKASELTLFELNGNKGGKAKEEEVLFAFITPDVSIFY